MTSSRNETTGKAIGDTRRTTFYEGKVPDRNRITSPGFCYWKPPITGDTSPNNIRNNNAWSSSWEKIEESDDEAESSLGSSRNEITGKEIAPSYEYEVFLSFRGEDTRESFASTLYYSLCKVHKVKTFMDVVFKKGSRLEELLKMVEKCRMSIVIFSENFAESEWCLKELVKIFEENDRRGHEVFPVFYKVNPSELRHLDKGKTKEHMGKHINTYGKDSNKIKSWSNAIKKFGNLSGYTYWSGRGKTEVQLVDQIAQDILDRLHG